MKIQALHLQAFLSFAQVRGIGREQLCQLLSDPAADLSSPGATIGHEDFYRVLAALHRQLQDDEMGWRIGQYLQLNALGLIYQISLQATTLEEAFYYLKDFLDTTCSLSGWRPG